MMYSHSDWNHKQGTLPVQWKPKDYESLPWYENPDKDLGIGTTILPMQGTRKQR